VPTEGLFRRVWRAVRGPIRPVPPASSAGPVERQGRMYASAIPNRFNQGFPSYNLSADSEMVTGLRNLRSRSRQLVRDAAFAKSAKRAVVNNVIGTGIKMQPGIKTVRDTLSDRVNRGVREAFGEWCHAHHCHTGGELHFHDLERQLMGQVFEAGEIFVRMWPQRFGDSTVPLGLEIIEPERIADGYAQPAGAHWENLIRMGIEVDQFKRPVAYWIRDLHPGDIRLNVDRTDHYTRVPAEDIIHLKIIDRWPQTRGEPWLHAVARKLADMDGYSEAEIIAARGAAAYMGFIESNEAVDVFGERGADNTVQIQIEPGSIGKLAPGEKMNFNAPNRPNNGVEPFMRLMLREMAAGLGISYEVLSHDYSQANYSSSRLSLLDERDVWKSLQMWFIRSFRYRLHKCWLQAAVLSKSIPEIDIQDYALDPKKFEAVFFRPRGWQWIDPTKEVTAYKDAVKGGFLTVGQVIAQTAGGDDIEDVLDARSAELAFMDEKKLVYDTSPSVYVPAESRGQVLIDKQGEPAPAAVVSAQGLSDSGLAPTGAPVVPGAPPTSGATPKAPGAPLATKVPKDESVDVDEDEEDRSRRRLHLINSQRGHDHG
jgi:lambda family phage portal protein